MNRARITDTHTPVMPVDQVVADRPYTTAVDHPHWTDIRVTDLDVTDAGTIVAFDIYSKDWRNQPTTSHSAMNIQDFIRIFKPA